MIKIFETEEWFPTASHESDSRNQNLVPKISEISRPDHQLKVLPSVGTVPPFRKTTYNFKSL